MLNTIYYILYTICNIPCNYIITQAPSKSPNSYSPIELGWKTQSIIFSMPLASELSTITRSKTRAVPRLRWMLRWMRWMLWHRDAVTQDAAPRLRSMMRRDFR